MLSNLASKIKYNAVKVTASSSFIDQLSRQTQNNKSFIEEKKKIVEDKFEDVMSEAIKSLKVFTKSLGTDEDSFKKASSNLEIAQKLKPSFAEPYFYLAYLFIYIKEVELSIKYFNIANILNPDLEGLDELKEMIQDIMSSNIKNTIQKEQTFKPSPLSKTNTNQTPQGEAFKPQPLQAGLKRASNSYSQYNKF
ncbi:MAG: tetratricopeptide repeat protein [Candidatus Sericytochromatia bacterium]